MAFARERVRLNSRGRYPWEENAYLRTRVIYSCLFVSTRRPRVGGGNYGRVDSDAPLLFSAVCQHNIALPPLLMADPQERPLFFAGSDDEDMDDVQPAVPETTATAQRSSSNATQAHSSTQKPLFFVDSDEEESTKYRTRQSTSMDGVEDDEALQLDVDLPDIVDVPRAPSVSSLSSGQGSSRDSSPPPPRQSVDEPPPKRRKLSPAPPSAFDHALEPIYLGCFLVDNAWSTVKGTGYIKQGEEIRIERDEPDKPPAPIPKKPAKDKGNGGKKQLTIASMLRPVPVKPTKKKQDSVVRITNNRGFGESQ